MNSPVNGLRAASVVFGLACLGMLTRLLMQFDIVVGGRHLPLWLTAIGFLITGGLCAWLWKLSLPAKALNTAESHHDQPTAAAS